MNTRMPLLMTSTLILLLVPAAAWAQEWRGMGRVGGKVVDKETGQPLDGVDVKAMLTTSQNRGPQAKSNSKGDWAIGGVASGNWAIDFSKDGYETKSITLQISESGRIPPMEIRMKKKAAPVPDANAVVNAELVKAASLMNEKKYAEARAIYTDLATKYSDVKQFRPLIARSYYSEGNKEAAAGELRKALGQDPENVELKLLLGTTLMEMGKVDESRTLLSSVDETKITDPAVFINIGIGLINDKKHSEAVPWFDKAIARFPPHADGYYYRGVSYLTLGKTAEAKADLSKYVSIAPPDAPELATAKQILATIK